MTLDSLTTSFVSRLPRLPPTIVVLVQTVRLSATTNSAGRKKSVFNNDDGTTHSSSVAPLTVSLYPFSYTNPGYQAIVSPPVRDMAAAAASNALINHDNLTTTSTSLSSSPPLTVLPPPPPPSAFKQLPPARALPPHLKLVLSHSNPAPTPPPQSPLPALPAITSPLKELEAPLLAARASMSSRRQSWTRKPTSPGGDRGPSFDGFASTTSLDSETVSDAFLLNTLLEEHGHRALDEWHNNQFGAAVGAVHITESEIGHSSYHRDMSSKQPARPASRTSLASTTTKMRRRRSPPSAATQTLSRQTPTSPRNSIASDLISLSETSRSLHNLSKRLSGTFPRRESTEFFDPFEFDRFDDHAIKASRSARSSPNDWASTMSTQDSGAPSRRSGSSQGSLNSKRTSATSTSTTQYLLIPTTNTTMPPSPESTSPASPRPPLRARNSTANGGVSKDLLQKALDLADKRANLEARRAELLGLPPPSKSDSPVTEDAAAAMIPNDIGVTLLRKARGPPPRLTIAPHGEAGDDGYRPDTTSSLHSVSSTSTARPGIVLRPSTASENGFGEEGEEGSEVREVRQVFDLEDDRAERATLSTLTIRSPFGAQFSPSSMTFGGSCHRESKVPSPPPPVPSKFPRAFEFPVVPPTPTTVPPTPTGPTAPSSPPPVPSKRDSNVPPPLPPKDLTPATTPLASSFPVPPSTMPSSSLVPRSESPDISHILASTADKERRRSRSRSRPRDSCATAESIATGINSAPPHPTPTRNFSGVSRIHRTPTSSSSGIGTPASRLSRASSYASVRMARNYSYPSDVAALMEDEDDEFRPSSYYYSHAEGRMSVTGSLSAGGSLDDHGWPERDAAFGLHGIVGVVPEEFGEEDDGNSSESSLDLHTPLPDMLLRAGVLSSRSALLASGVPVKALPKSKAQKAAELAKGAGGKVISKNRLVRHRDGKNLGLGLGLTTGLGWSDSEDEDSPSPLRHHISQIILNKKTSQASVSSITSAGSVSNFSGSRRESVVSSTTLSSTNSRKSSNKGTGSSTSTLGGKSPSLSKLRTKNLRGSQSLAQISPKATVTTRQASMSIPGPSSSQPSAVPPSSFSNNRFNKASPSQQSSISSLGSVLQPPHSLAQSSLRSPASSSTSISTASSALGPTTPVSSNNSPASESSPALSSPPKVGLGFVTEDGKPCPDLAKGSSISRPQMRRISSTASVSTQSSLATGKSNPRSRASSRAMGPPSAFPPNSTPLPASSGSSSSTLPTRKRTLSSGSTGGQNTGIPGPRTRTTSTSSVATNASAAPHTIRSKSSMASVRSVAHSVNSAKDVLPPPPSMPVMTLGSLAFPSPPPLTPALNMRLAQSEALKKHGVGGGLPTPRTSPLASSGPARV